MTARLAELATDEATGLNDTPDPTVVAGVQEMLSNPNYGKSFANLRIEGFLQSALANNAEALAGLDLMFPNWTDGLTLGKLTSNPNAATIGGSKNFLGFVFANVPREAQVVAGEDWVLVAYRTVNNASAKIHGNNPVLLRHSHPNDGSPLEVSQADLLAAANAGQYANIFSQSMVVDGRSMVFYGAGGPALVIGMMTGIPEVKPLDTAYQSTAFAGVMSGEVDDPMIQLVKNIERPVTDETRAAENELVDLFVDLIAMDLPSAQLKTVLTAIENKVVGPATFSIERYLADENVGKVGVNELADLIAAQMGRLQAVGGMVKPTYQKVAGFANIAELPAEMGWVRERTGDLLNLQMQDVEAAESFAKTLRARIAARGRSDLLFAQIFAIAGGETNLNARIAATQPAGLTTTSNVRKLLNGKATRGFGSNAGTGVDKVARTTAARLLVEPLVEALSAATGLRTDPRLRRVLDNLTVEVVSSQEELDSSIRHGKAGIIYKTDKNGKLTATIQILIGEDATAEETVIQLVGRLTHELGHVYADALLDSLRKEGRLPETLSDELLAAYFTRITLRYQLKVAAIADVVDLETAERVIEMKDLEAYYVDYASIKGRTIEETKKNLDALAAKVKESKAKKRAVLFTRNPRDFKEAQELAIVRGLHLVTTDDIRGAKPRIGTSERDSETPLEAHARQTFGTSRVALIAKGSDKDREELAFLMTVRLADGTKKNLAGELFRAITDFAATAQLGKIMNDELVARLIGRQA
jgi:hypothetical protein